ncbi:hypothetical protein ACT17Q_15740 [Cellulomonas sp. CW35]|uniref:hypothetical protein n=1 Tax=Cellulomonas sp. CW35 TaxID=3458249 RepID=UPI00403411C2
MNQDSNRDEPRAQDDWDRRYASLDEALRDHKVPLENHALIRAITSRIEIKSFYAITGYIKAVRSHVGPALQIHYGYTNGFLSREEALHAVGDHVEIWPSRRGTGQWGVSHPVHGSASGGSRETRAERRDFGTCPICRYAFAANGTCDCS